jgi:predicted permease
MSKRFTVEGRPPVAQRSEVARVSARQESARSLQAMGVALRRGRYFSDGDHAAAERVAIINETLARTFFPNDDPLGHQVLLEVPEHLLRPEELPPGGRHTRWTIVGVVGDVRYRGLGEPAEPCVYVPYLQRNQYMPWAPQYLVVQLAGESATVVDALREQLRQVDKDLGMAGVLTIEDLTRQSAGNARNTFTLLAAFGGLALLLALIGLYSIVSYSVGQRTREIGIRSALGARPQDILRMVLGGGLKLVGIGIAVGWTLSLALERVLAGLLYEVSPGDPVALGAAVVTMAVTAALASWVPARRASHIAPLDALREE